MGLLGQLQALEREFGRSRSGPANAPRTLDLDLIALGSERHSGPGLVLPHPRAHLRAFVLAPLAELEPDWVLPGQQETVAELLARIGSGPPVQRVTAGARQ